MSEAKERPILFSGPMVRAILEGRKTQTRRVVKGLAPHDFHPQMTAPGRATFLDNRLANPYDGALDVRCPYGQPGDRLWVRESFFFRENGKAVVYRADIGDAVEAAGMGALYGGWKPSIHMPRWASRLTLEISDVRVERVQEISWMDAIAEGIRDPRRCAARVDPVHGCVAKFRELWDSINAARGHGWDVNPWTWAITFKRMEQSHV